MALPLSMFVLVVIGAIVTGNLAVALLEQRTGRNILYAVQAAGAAEAGVTGVVAVWDSYGLDGLVPGDSAVLPAVQLSGGTTYQARVHRLNTELFQLRAMGIRSDAGGAVLARRQLGLILRRGDSAVAGAPTVVPLAHRAWSWMSP